MESYNLGNISILENLQCPVLLDETFRSNTDRTYTSWFFESKSSELNGLCDKYSTDKGGFDPETKTYPWLSHNYAYFYEHLFQHIRPFVTNIFEFGIGTNDAKFTDNMTAKGVPGASLRVWRDYFPMAEIHGADIDKNVLFTEERIRTYFVDQLDQATFDDLWKNFEDVQFDIIIDDGLHTFEAGINTFANSFHKLSQGGLYIIEDVRGTSPLEFLSFFKKNREFNFQIVWLNRSNGTRKDCLLVIRKNYDQ